MAALDSENGTRASCFFEQEGGRPHDTVDLGNDSVGVDVPDACASRTKEDADAAGRLYVTQHGAQVAKPQRVSAEDESSAHVIARLLHVGEAADLESASGPVREKHRYLYVGTRRDARKAQGKQNVLERVALDDEGETLCVSISSMGQWVTRSSM